MRGGCSTFLVSLYKQGNQGNVDTITQSLIRNVINPSTPQSTSDPRATRGHPPARRRTYPPRKRPAREQALARRHRRLAAPAVEALPAPRRERRRRPCASAESLPSQGLPLLFRSACRRPPHGI